MAEKIYADQQKAINQCITEVANHIQNNKDIISIFEEKLNKTILNTKQVATNPSKTCGTATSLKFQVSDSRSDNLEDTLLDHDEEIQNMINKISVYSQQKGHFAGTHSTVPNYNDTT
eukprot:15169106-Ditylum_brightwellii.AAC.1